MKSLRDRAEFRPCFSIRSGHGELFFGENATVERRAAGVKMKRRGTLKHRSTRPLIMRKKARLVTDRHGRHGQGIEIGADYQQADNNAPEKEDCGREGRSQDLAFACPSSGGAEAITMEESR